MRACDERKRTGGYLCNLGRERSAYNGIGDAGHSAVRWRSPRDRLVVRARFHRRLERQQEGEKQVSAHPSVRHVQGPTKVSISRTGINTSVNNADGYSSYHFPPDNCDARRMKCGKLAWPMLSHNSQLSDGKGQKPRERNEARAFRPPRPDGLPSCQERKILL